MDSEVFYHQGRESGFVRILFYPLAKFILNYFLKLGFLDGMGAVSLHY